MATPRNQNYSVASGAGVYAGRPRLPAWFAALTVGQWGAISGTAGLPANLKPDSFCGYAIKPETSEILCVAAGGHDAGNTSNGAASLNLTDDAPAWDQRRASTWNGSEIDVLYYADGSPASCHVYSSIAYIAGLDAVLLPGRKYVYGPQTLNSPGMDLFSLADDDYLARYTYPDVPSLATYGFGVVLDGAGHVWTEKGYKFNVSTETWSKPGSGTLLRFPVAYDSTRDKIFALQWGDGQGFDAPQVNAVQLDPATGNSQTISFNASAALTQFQGDAPTYAAMEFCPLDGKFYFLHGGRMGTFYVVTPNAGTTWDIALYSPGGTTPSVHASGLHKRLLWVPDMQGFFVHGSANANASFLRMA